MIDFNFFNQTHTCSKQMKSECARDKKNKICCYAHASGGDRTRAIDVTMWCHLFNIFPLWDSFGFGKKYLRNYTFNTL